MVKRVPFFGTVGIREYTQCHVQSGEDGGRFCSTTGTGGGAAPAAGSSGGPARTAAAPSPGNTGGEAPPTKPDAGEKPLAKLPPNFKELSPAQRDKLADVKRSIDRRVAELVGAEKWPSTGSMARDIGQRVKSLSERMSPESQLLVRQMALDLHRQLVSAKGDTPAVRKLVQHATDVLSAQEIEAAERVLGDHGVHHLEGDYRMALDTLKAKGGVTAADRASLMLAAIYHDTGYMTEPSRQWNDSDHPRWSTQYYDAKIKPMVAATLGQKVADELSTTIATHADPDMDWEAAPRASAFRLGDNLALFHKEKIPAPFRDGPENRTVMERWPNGGLDTESARIHDFFSNMQSQEYIRHDELPLETKDGRVVDVEFVSNSYMVDAVKVVQCNIRSIADRKRAEEALRLSETYFEGLFISMTEGVAVHRIIYGEKGTATDYVTLNVNPAYEVHTGIERKDAIGKRASELYATGKAPYFDIYEKVAATKRPAHFETYFDPLKRHFRISVFSPGEGLFATVFDDITERKKGEDALKESEQRFRDITENALEWIWEVDTTGKYTFVSHVVEKILGYRADEIIGKHFYDLFHPEDKEALKSAALGSLPRSTAFREFLNRNIHKSGKTVWLSTSGTPIFDDKGNLLGYRGADTDITEIREAAEALRDSEELFRSVTQSALDAIIVVDGSGTIQVWNNAAETLFGYSMHEAHGKPVTMIIPERLRTAHKKGMRRFMSSGKSKIMGRNYEVTARHKDGSEFPVEISLASWERKGNVLFTGVIRDITTRKKLEEQLQTASITDELTGLLNRRGFLSFAQKYVEIARRNKRNFSILYIDLNEMKKINDEFGHREGDQALLDIAEILRKTFRSSDIIARIGGDEFTVLMTDTHGSAVEKTIAQYIRNNLRIHNERTEKGYELSVSMGMVHNDPEQRCSIDELLAQADELMYEHKKLKAETIPSSRGWLNYLCLPPWL